MAKSKRTKNKSGVEDEKRESDVVKGKLLETIDVKIKTIGENPEKKSAPVIGYFPSGYDPLKGSGIPGAELEPKPSVKIYQSMTSPNPKKPRMQLVVGANGCQVNFVGTNYSGEAAMPQLCNYALGVLDKDTGVLKMVPIATNRIFRLEPKIGISEHPENEVPEEEVTADGRLDKLRNLTAMYSTKKNIRRDNKFSSLRKPEDPETQQDLDNKLKEIKINKDALEAAVSTANSRNIPPYNQSAEAPDMAYPLDKIIFEGEWDYLGGVFELAQTGSEINPGVYPNFVCNRFQSLKNIEDEFEKRRMAGILSYITHLIKFRDCNTLDGLKSAKHHKLPSIFSQKFYSMFGSENRRIPDEKRALLISYILVLSLHADNFRSNPEDLAKDLRMNLINLRTHYEYLGCKFVRENKVLVATLPVPLGFYTSKTKRGRR